MTKFLLKRLRLAKGKPVFTSELALRFARDHDVDLSLVTRAELMDRVGRRLCVMTTTGMGSWSLVADNQDELQT